MVAAFLYIAFMLFVVRPLLGRVAERTKVGLSQNLVAVILVGVLLSSFATETIGIHALFGAFLFGAVFPKQGSLASALAEKIAVYAASNGAVPCLPLSHQRAIDWRSRPFESRRPPNRWVTAEARTSCYVASSRNSLRRRVVAAGVAQRSAEGVLRPRIGQAGKSWNRFAAALGTTGSRRHDGLTYTFILREVATFQ